MSNPEKLYEGLPKEFGTSYRQEAMDKYGKETIEKAENELLKMAKPDFEQLKEDFDQINQELFEHRNELPESEAVQQLIGHHYVLIRRFWGTQNSSDPQANAYAGLGQLYLSDERYTLVNGQAQPAFAAFLAKAMQFFVDTSLK